MEEQLMEQGLESVTIAGSTGDAALAADLQRLIHGVLHGLMEQAVRLQRAGEFDQARAFYGAVLQEQPGHSDANHNLAVIALESGDHAGAVRHFEAALGAQPGYWQYWISLVDAHIQTGAVMTAARVLEDARRAGLPGAAIDEIAPRLVVRPTVQARAAEQAAPSGAAVTMLTLLLNQKRHVELAECAGTLTRQFPENALGWRMRGLALAAQGDDAGASAAWLGLTRLCPHDVENWNTWGLSISGQDRLLEAEMAFRTALALDPQHAVAQCNLGFVLHRRGSLRLAEQALLRSLELRPDYPVACLNLSVVKDELGDPAQAETWVRRALVAQPDFVHAHTSLGYLLKDQGRIDEGLASIERALQLDALNLAAHSNRLFLLNYHPDKPAHEIFAAYQQFDRQLCQPLREHWQPHPNDRDSKRRLRVGYVCPSFHNHSARHFLEPLLACHDHAKVEVFAYAEMNAPPDAMTARYRSSVDHWLQTNGLSDAELAQRIRDDRIDVLVDIAGHTRGHRLPVFARKPAPVSLHWLDYGYTTGVTAIDYYLTDDATAPPGSEALFAEAPWRLPVPAFVYRPSSGMGEVGRLPALAAGHLTFGTLTRAIRINHRTVRAWSAVLHRVAGSRMVVDSSNFKDPGAAQRLAQQFVDHGIAPERLSIGYHSPPWDVLRGIDIGLDCFPHNSGTTLFEMLYMGVPYVTLAGRPSVGRVGSAVLQGLGEPGWISSSEEDYVQAAVAMAGDLPALARIRARLRQQMQDSPLMDEAGFARRVEDAYRKMFSRWCATQGAAIQLAATDTQPVAAGVGESVEALLQRALQQAMAAAVLHHRARQLPEAEDGYREILQACPDHPDANHNLAVIALECGKAEASLPLFRRAHLAQPGNWQYWLSYFDGLLQSGQRHAATTLLESRRRSGLGVALTQELVERVVNSRFAALSAHAPRDPQAMVASADSRRSKRRPHADSPSAQEFARIDDRFKQGRMADVARLARTMTRRHPRAAYGWKALGAAMVNLGEFAEALDALQQASDLAPADAGALSNLGFALHNQRRPVEAEVNLRLALRLQPGFASAIINLGSAVLGQDRYDEAATWYEQGLALEPGYIPAHSHLAQVRDEQVRLVEAVAGYRKTLALLAASNLDLKASRFDVTLAHAHQGLSSTLAKLSDFTEVVAQSDAALAVQPQDPVLWEKRLYAFSYHPDLPQEKIFAEFVRWGNRFPAPQADFSRHDRTLRRRLRVGYVSPDFRQHTSRFYFLPFFANHDHAVVEIFAYSNVKVEDGFTAQFKAVFDHWRDIRELDDAAVAALVRSDAIDILVDGCNHMRDDRLGVFALKPAPLQVTWLGAAWTTGLKAVDYVLFDSCIAPPQTLAREAIVRLPHCFVPFQSMEQTDMPQPPPSVANGFVTFAYSGRTERLNHHTFRVWGEILRRLPGAVLVLDFRTFADPLNREHFRALMARCGLDPERVVMRNSSNIFKALHDFDILLDCFPHSGGTMLVDALWMGVPALTLASRPPLGRIGTTFVTNIGLPEWVAYSEEEYIDKACAFAANTAMRVALRAGMRQRMLQSPLMDGPGFARGVETAYRAMWERFCAGQAPAPLTISATSGPAP
ncbi:MAG: tetratricopeptide repeat protein [Rhodoferax sp.]|nr:tetratricopeptide repeat protein [Rhodoferax sp.]